MFDSIGEMARFGPLLVLALIGIEATALHWQKRRGYDLKESAATLGILAGQLVLRGATASLLAPIFAAIYQHRLLTIPMKGLTPWLVLFFAVEFLYYWMHRASHRVHWLWASHQVHHSTQRLNFSSAYRLGWTAILSGSWLFFTPLILLGFHPASVFGMLALNLGYQFFLHTETIGSLGPLEGWINTPAGHRVHHAAGGVPFDQNFGGMLLVFDRLFGTYTAEPRERKLAYGIAGRPVSYNPIRIAFAGWFWLLHELRDARSPRAVWHALFGAP